MKLQKKRLSWFIDVCLAKLTEVKAQCNSYLGARPMSDARAFWT